MPDLRTMQDVNAWLEYCGHCPFELTPAPRKECGSVNLTLCAFTTDDIGILEHPTVDERPVLYATCIYSGNSTYTESDRDDSENHAITFTKEPAAVVAGDSCGNGRINGTYTATISNDFPDPSTQVQAIETRSGTVNAIDAGTGVDMVVNFTAIEYDSSGVEISSNTDTFDLTLEFLTFAALVSGAGWSGSTLTYTGFDALFSVEDGPQSIALSDAYTRATAAAAINGVTVAEEEFSGTECASALTVTLAADGVRITAASAVIARYRYGVPAAYPRADYIAQWDEYFFPAAWDAWDQGGRIGTEPTPVPSLIASRAWTWAGSLAAPWSPWFILPAQENAGEVRPVNFLVKAADTKYGNKPTAHGEIYIPTTP